MTPASTILGPGEVADLLAVRRKTVAQWRLRGVLPDPTWTISGVPIWRREVVLRWAAETGRLVEAS